MITETDDLPPEPPQDQMRRAVRTLKDLEPAIAASMVRVNEPPSLENQAEAEAALLRAQIVPVMVRAAQYACVSPADYESAATILGELANMESAIDAKLGPLIETANKTHKGLTSLRAEMKAPILERVRVVKQRAADWRVAEQKRASDEAARLSAAQQQQDRARAEETAQALEQAGEQDAATQVREEARTAPAPAVVPDSKVPTAKTTGLIGTYDYGFEIVNRDLIPDEYWCVDEKAIGAVVKSQRDACTIPGIRVTKTPATRFRKGARG